MKLKLIALVLFSSLLLGQTVQRDRTALREGPGAWYPLISELSTGTQVKIVKALENWVEVQSGNQTGYISARALQKKSEPQDVFAQMAKQSTGTQVGHAGVTAAVKGFADRFSKRLAGDPGTLNYIQALSLNTRSYSTFREETIASKTLRKLRRKLRLPKLKKDKPFSFSEEGSGYAIAAKLGTLGLVKDAGLEQYVNQVGTFVAEQSQGYDISFKFIILDQDGVNGYACPGGIIFITRGAIELMRSEAELACFLGHEISHVVNRHGMKEMEERKEMIVSGNAFDEMSMSVGESADITEVSQDLDDMALNSYETIFKGRLGKYEQEADEHGLLYAARSGYDPKAMIEFLKRVGKSNSIQGSEHYSDSQNDLRIKRISKFVSGKPFKGRKEFSQQTKRFRKMMN